MGSFDFEDFLERFDEGTLSLLVAAGALAGAFLVEWSRRNFQRIAAGHSGRIAHCGLPGQKIAERLLAACGLGDVRVTRGGLLDVYHPARREVRLTPATYDTPSLWSLAVAAHEVGHAQQFAAGLLRTRLRLIFWPVCYAFPCVVLVLWMICLTALSSPPETAGLWLPLAFAAVVLLQLPITLPLERDASARARRLVQQHGLIAEDELQAFDELLDSAWKTHAAGEARRGILAVIVVAVAVCFPAFYGRLDGADELPLDMEAAAWAAAAPAEILPMDSMTPDDAYLAVAAPLFEIALAVVPLVFGLVVLSKVSRWARRKPTLAELAAARSNAATELFAQEQFSAAIEGYTAALAIDPHLTVAHFNRGSAWLKLGRLDQALADFETTLQMAPRYANALVARGTVRLARGDLAGAAADLDAALEVNPDSLEGRLWRGHLWMAKSEYQRAIADYTHVVTRDPVQAEAFGGRGLARYFAGDFAAAILDLSESLRLAPSDGMTWNNRGAAFLKAGEYARAASDLREAIRLKPDLPNAWRHLAWLQATCPDPAFRDGPQAVANATRALELSDWKQTDWLEVLAAACAEAGNFDGAGRWQQQAIDAAPPCRQAELANRLSLYRVRQPFRTT